MYGPLLGSGLVVIAELPAWSALADERADGCGRWADDPGVPVSVESVQRRLHELHQSFLSTIPLQPRVVAVARHAATLRDESRRASSSASIALVTCRATEQEGRTGTQTDNAAAARVRGVNDCVALRSSSTGFGTHLRWTHCAAPLLTTGRRGQHRDRCSSPSTGSDQSVAVTEWVGLDFDPPSDDD